MTEQTGITEERRQELRERYLAERDKRLRTDGNSQYLEPTGRFAGIIDDPYTKRIERDAVNDDVTVAIVGAGFSGLVTGAALRKAGIENVRLLDAAGDVGGVWYWNRYPGAMCDTAAMIYLPLLEETGTVPSAKYVPAHEIFAHAQRIATTFGLYENALLSTSVTEVSWEAAISRWRITTDRGDNFTAKFIATGTGPLHRPKLPGIDGIDSFAGHAFHTSRWDYDYCGGGPADVPMDKLGDKRVAIIGTGATAVQCIPKLGRDAGELFVFQRTPSSIDVRNNHPIDPEWFASLEPGWQREWLRNFTLLQTGGYADVDLVMDGWTDISQRVRDRVAARVMAGAELGPETTLAAYEESDDEKMEEIRARVDTIVTDPATAEALKPWYRQLCKRPCFHDEYLQTYNRPNVTLVDTDGQGVERIDATGIWANGQHYEVDCIVFASGFEVGTDLSRRSGFQIAGENGLSLEQHWAAGMRTLHGTHVDGFPNLFVLATAQAANLISNVPHNYVEASDAIAAVVSHAENTGATRVEANDADVNQWLTRIQGRQGSVIGSPDCTPGYYNNEGKPLEGDQQLNGGAFIEGPVAYFEYLEQWWKSGEFSGLTFT